MDSKVIKEDIIRNRNLRVDIDVASIIDGMRENRMIYFEHVI